MEPSSWQFDRTGGHVALDFANTVSERQSEQPVEHLGGYDALVEFGRQTALVTPAQAERLRETAARDPDAAARVMTEAVALREALYRIFTEVALGRAPSADALFTLNAFVARLRIGPDLDWTWQAGDAGLDAPLGAVVRAALELLTGDLRERIGRCGNPDCRFLFVDTSKNRSRRWCEMQSCGNRMKARRHYRRARRPSGQG